MKGQGMCRTALLMLRRHHPNIIRIHEFYEDPNSIFIVTELCTGGELFDRIIQQTHFTEKKAKDTMYQILSAVSYCHAKGIVHRDLKPENVLYDSPDANSNLKVIDFGTSSFFDRVRLLEKRLGTVN